MIFALDGDDVVQAGGGPDTVDGGLGDDVLLAELELGGVLDRDDPLVVRDE